MQKKQVVWSVLVAIVLCLAYGPRAIATPTVQEIVTPGGVRLWHAEEPAVPLVSLRFSVDGSIVEEPDGQEGVTSLLAATLTEGAAELDALAFARRLEHEGARLDISASRDRIRGSLDVLSARAGPAGELLGKALAAPRIDADALERVRQQRLSEIETAAADPRRAAVESWYTATFGAKRGRPVDGTLASVGRVTRLDILARHAQMMTRARVRVVVVGDIKRRAASDLVDRIFGSLPPGRAYVRDNPSASLAGGREVVVEKKAQLASVAFGCAALKPDHPDYAALEVLNQIIGSGDFDAVLMEEIRVKRGLAYGVTTSLIQEGGAGFLLGGMSTKADAARKALDVLKQVLSDIAINPLPVERIEAARDFLVGSWSVDHDTNAKIATLLMRLWNEGRGPSYVAARNDRIRAVTPKDVQRVASSLLQWTRFNAVIAGPAD